MVVNNELAHQLAKEIADYIPEFQATQRRKERRNIIIAFYKMRKGEALKKREVEAYRRYVDYVYEKWLADQGDGMI